ncbi:MAG TPA: hypothetical protein VNK95_16810 [Caldilineaceae bacterium]|nr:hypothetical protein [Caldilineaceae bacterium]
MKIPDRMQADEAMVDDLIAWLRGATCERVMDEAARYLAAGVGEEALWAASVLTAAHYVNNQAHNLMGFVSHAMVGAEDARQLARTQPPRTRYLLLLQSLHQTVADLHDPSFSPYHLLPFWPIHEAGDEESIAWLRRDVRMGEYSRADHRFVGLAERLPRLALVDLLLDIGLEGMVTDDHTLISPVLSLGMMELLGWERGFDLLRWAVRYSASFPINFAPYDRSVEYLRFYGLEAGAPTTAFQPERVQPLSGRFLAADAAARPELAARLLAEEGCSPATLVAAASRAACAMYLMVEPVPHADFDAISREVAPIHIGNCLRLLATALNYLTPRTQALAALQAGSVLERGPTVISPDFRFVPFEPARPYPYAEDVAALASYGAPDLLDYLREVMPHHDGRRVTAAIRAYADQGAAAEPLIALLTELACTDHGTLMHNVKHLNSMVIEFRRAPDPDRWLYLMQGARFLSWYCGLTTGAFERADAALREHYADSIT